MTAAFSQRIVGDYVSARDYSLNDTALMNLTTVHRAINSNITAPLYCSYTVFVSGACSTDRSFKLMPVDLRVVYVLTILCT